MPKNWSDDEIEALVRCQMEMKDKESKGIKFSKVNYYKNLFNKFEISFEYRMQNIAFVFSELGREWGTSLKPAKNLGSHIFGKIDKIITRLKKEA